MGRNIKYSPVAGAGEVLWRLVKEDERDYEGILNILHDDFKHKSFMLFEAVSIGYGVQGVKKGMLGMRSDCLNKSAFLKTVVKVRAKDAGDDLYMLPSMGIEFLVEKEMLDGCSDIMEGESCEK